MNGFRDNGPQCVLLGDRRRVHLNHGPIDIILEAFGERHEVVAAYWQAQRAFRHILPGLVEELALLRSPIQAGAARPSGDIASRMYDATRPHAAAFITPMAAVAGAVADHILAAAVAGRTLDRAYANNGGDIALYLAQDETFRVAVATDADAVTLTVSGKDSVRGVATSGWRGRSHSLGIADSVTVLAMSSATADAAATLIANEVDLPGSMKIERTPADELSPDSDLGDRPVTTGVADLDAGEIDVALNRGVLRARQMKVDGLIEAAQLTLQGQVRVVGDFAALPSHGRRIETLEVACPK